MIPSLSQVALFASLLLLSVCSTAGADLLVDNTGDGQVVVLAFGDSITAGVGDGTFPGDYVEIAPSSPMLPGYPGRLTELLGVPVIDSGVPGEVLSDGGVYRFASSVISNEADVVVFLEGTNDAVFQISPSELKTDLHKIANIATVLERSLVFQTIPRTCCNHTGSLLFTTTYSSQIRQVAALHGLPIVDLESEWKKECPLETSCSLLNAPEGLHPNSAGYDFMAELVEDTLLNY
ncbi:MAG: SGNH/GDSL hydrolase family protein [Bdellovibrionales bacterium]|nr:SGNH/GDSL hydrolase family protein [Bdellovibrionales bacterium]